jgi:hypothetical protein
MQDIATKENKVVEPPKAPLKKKNTPKPAIQDINLNRNEIQKRN